MDLRETYNQIAERWHREHSNDDWWVVFTDKYLKQLKPGASVLDVGCGAGTKSRYLTRKGFKVTGIDFAEKMIELAKSEVPEAQFLVKDIREPLGLEAKFNGVFAQAVLLHIPKKEVMTVLNNITAPLKSGGFLYIAVKEIRSHEREEMMVKDRDCVGEGTQRFFSYFRLPELRKYLTDAGLVIVDDLVAMTGRRNWIQIIAQKT